MIRKMELRALVRLLRKKLRTMLEAEMAPGLSAKDKEMIATDICQSVCLELAMHFQHEVLNEAEQQTSAGQRPFVLHLETEQRFATERVIRTKLLEYICVTTAYNQPICDAILQACEGIFDELLDEWGWVYYPPVGTICRGPEGLGWLIVLADHARLPSIPSYVLSEAFA